MQKRTLLSFLFSILVVGYICGQDLHYSNYNFAPLYLNPAKTGDFLGTIRIGGIYREEARFFINNPFQTQNIHIDSPLSKGFSKNHWVGLGLNIYTDKAGDIAAANNGMMLSGAFYKLPNVFSPNNDGLNDFFNVIITESSFIEAVTIINFKVYNRWGNLLYDNDNPDTGWDGNHQNERSPAEVYAYVVELEIQNCNNEFVKGNITLIR
jgi:gliding motility-associated-like protein